MKIWRDSDGDLWARTDDGRVWLCAAVSGTWEGPATRTWEDVARRYGPLTELPTSEAHPHVAAVTALADRIRPASGNDQLTRWRTDGIGRS